MRWEIVLAVLGRLLLILAASLLVPLAAALIYDSRSPLETREIIGFAVTVALSFVAGLALRYRFRKPIPRSTGPSLAPDGDPGCSRSGWAELPISLLMP